MKKWIHEKTSVIRYADISEKTAKGHGFIPFKEPELQPVPKKEEHKTEPLAVKTEAPKEEKPKPTKRRGRQRKKVD
jgi:hypothetical protein